MTLKLQHPDDNLKFKKGMDLTISSNGDIATIVGKDELMQDVNKAIVTYHIDDGYGTYIYKLRGMKNLELMRTLGILSVLESLQLLKQNQLVSQAKGRLQDDAILTTVENVKITQQEQTLTFSVGIISKNLSEAVNVTL